MRAWKAKSGQNDWSLCQEFWISALFAERYRRRLDNCAATSIIEFEPYRFNGILLRQGIEELWLRPCEPVNRLVGVTKSQQPRPSDQAEVSDDPIKGIAEVLILIDYENWKSCPDAFLNPAQS